MHHSLLCHKYSCVFLCIGICKKSENSFVSFHGGIIYHVYPLNNSSIQKSECRLRAGDIDSLHLGRSTVRGEDSNRD